MRKLTIALLGAAALVAVPAQAQTKRTNTNGSTVAQQALASGTQPDVLLDVPNLSLDELTVEVDKLQVNISLDARLANLLKLTAGAEAGIEKVKIQLKGVQAQATLIVRLDNVRAILERTLQTLDNNPQILQGLTNTLNTTVGTVGGVANNALGTVGGVANNALGTVGGVTTTLLQNGQVLDLARSGLTQLGQTTNAAGQIVRQVRDTAGNVTEVVTDSAGKIVSSRRLPR